MTAGTIGRAMELLDLDMGDVARAIGCTRGTLQRWRRGAQDPSARYRDAAQNLDAFMYELTKRARSRAREWFDSRVPALGNHTPRDVFQSGRLAHLVVYLRQHERL